MALLEAKGLTVTYGGLNANDEIDLECETGKLVGLIGPNGAGKTTFIDAITGFTPITRGYVGFDGVDLAGLRPDARAKSGLVRTFQSLELFEDLTVRGQPARRRRPAEVVLVPVRHRHAESGQGSRARADRRGASTRWSWATSPTSIRATSATANASWSASPGRWPRNPKLLLLDEPAAGLDTQESQLLGSHLRSFLDLGVSLFLIDHDMGLVLNVCDYIYVLDFGRVIAHGTPAQVRADPAVIAAYLGESAGEAQAEAGAAANRSAEPVTAPRRRNRGIAITRHRRPAMSDEFLIDVQGLHAGYGGIPVLRDITLNVGPGEVVALLGPNGAGKTTTLLTISGLLAPLAGVVTVLGEPVTGHKAYAVARRGLAHVPEDRSLFFDLTVDENIRLGLKGNRAERKEAHDRAMELLPALKPLGKRQAGLLSGGEQQMLAMARALVSSPEVHPRRRDEPRPRPDHRGAPAADRARHRRPDRVRRARRRTARPHGARGRRPRVRPEPRRDGAGRLRRRTVGEPPRARSQLPR